MIVLNEGALGLLASLLDYNFFLQIHFSAVFDFSLTEVKRVVSNNVLE